MLPTFASHWLIPRIKSFYDRTPDVREHGQPHRPVLVRGHPLRGRDPLRQADLAGTSSDYLFGEEVVPICSPALLDAVHSVEDLLAYPLLHSTTRPGAWAQWFETHGVEDIRTMQGVRYELHTMLISAAAAGHRARAEVLRRGTVAAARAGGAVRCGDGRRFRVLPRLSDGVQPGKPLELFRGWLLEQASAYAAPDVDADGGDIVDDEDVE